jgi:hypothetical protein
LKEVLDYTLKGISVLVPLAILIMLAFFAAILFWAADYL